VLEYDKDRVEVEDMQTEVVWESVSEVEGEKAGDVDVFSDTAG